MWVQTGGPPDKPVFLFDDSTSRAQDVPSRLLESYRGYLMTDDYAGYNTLGVQPGIERDLKKSAMSIATKVNSRTVYRCWRSFTSGWRKTSLK